MTFPKVSLTIEDQTIQQPTAVKGVCALAIQTQRGRIGSPVFLRSFQEYREEYGEIVDPTDTIGPILAKRVFDNGGQMYVTRIVHFTDINDPATFTPAEATGNNGGVFPFSEQIIAIDGPGQTITINGDLTDYVLPGQAHVVQLAGGGSVNLTTIAGTPAVFAGGTTTITYTTALGATASNDTLTWSVSLTASLNYEASSAGAWGNVIEVEIRRAASGISGALDIFARSTNGAVVGTDLNEVYRNFPATPTSGDIQLLNETMKLINLIDPPISTPIAVVPPNLLTGGTDDYASVTELDYVGSTSANTGIRSLDEESGFTRLSAPEITSNVVDLALLAYAKERQDCVAILRTPESLTARQAIDYRNQVGAFAGGTAIDDWQATMLFGGIKVTSPYAPDGGAELVLPWIGDFLGISAKKDNDLGEWFNPSGVNRGILSNVRDIVYNIFTPNRKQEAEDLTDAGLYPIIKKKISGIQRIVIWGDKSLQRVVSALQFANVGDLLIAISNGIKPLSEESLFDPNDVLTWKTIYRKVAVFMQDLINRRGIEAFRYEGDQNADTIADAVINTPTTINQGRYIFNLFFSPIPSLREVEITAIATEQGVLISTEGA